MSDLQTILIVIGAMIIVIVLVVNWWQERRFHQQVESNFSPLHSDALLDDPKLDAASLYTSLDDPASDGFSVDNAMSDQAMLHQVQSLDDNAFDDTTTGTQPDNATQSYTFRNAQPDDMPIKATYAQPAKESVSQDSNFNTYNNLDADVDIKPTQHDDIKAIFHDAFSHANKAAAAYEQTPYEAVKSEPNDTMALEESVPDAATEVIQNEIQESTLSLPAMLHAQMDLTAVLYLAAETSVSKLSGSLMGLLSGYDKPVYLHVLDSNKQWSLLQEATSNQQISKVACSLQLADRAGPISRHTLNRFQLAVETMGLDINAHVEWQSTGDALTTAVALDTFCIEVDKSMGFHLVHGEHGAFTGTKLRGLAEAQGLMLASDGTFKYFDEASGKDQAQASFVMFNRDDYSFSQEMLRTSVVKGITFQLDIPHVKQCAEAFSQMVQVARQMEIGLNALLVDDNNKMLGDIQIEKIRQQLKIIHATMLVRGIVPGSDSALRLFS